MHYQKNILLVFLSTIFFSIHSSANHANIDSLSNALNRALQNNNTIQQIDLYYELGQAMYKKKEYQRAVDHFHKMSLSAKLQKDQKNLGKSLFYLGKSYRKAENNNLAITTLEELISLPPGVNKVYLDRAHFEVSKAYQSISDHEKAYKHQINCLQLREEENDSSGQMRCLYQLGSIFYYQDNYELALDFYQRTNDFAKKINDDKYQYNSLAAIGSAYQKMDNMEGSVRYTKQALALAKTINYSTGLAYSYANMGENFFLLEKYDSAMYFINKSLLVTNRIKDHAVKATALMLSGKTHLKLNKPQRALALLDSALHIATKYQYNSQVLLIYQELADTYEALIQPIKSNNYLRSYIDLKDSLVNESILLEMGKVQTKYEVLKKEKELAQKDSEFEKLSRNFLTGGIILLLGLLWFIYSSYKQQRKSNNLLAIKNEEIELQNQQLERSNAELQQFAYIASHDLKEPLRNIGSYASLINRRYKDKMDGECLEFFSYIQLGIAKMYQLLNDVLDFSKLDHESNQKQLVKTTDIVHSVALNLEQQIKEKNARILISDLPDVKANEVHISQLFQNLISNGLKFTNGKIPEIKVSCQTSCESKYVFSVQDNGIGFDMAYKEKVFEMFQRLDKRKDVEGTGVGLAICKKIIQQYDGEIWVESAPNHGSTFYFSLPSVAN